MADTSTPKSIPSNIYWLFDGLESYGAISSVKPHFITYDTALCKYEVRSLYNTEYTIQATNLDAGKKTIAIQAPYYRRPEISTVFPAIYSSPNGYEVGVYFCHPVAWVNNEYYNKSVPIIQLGTSQYSYGPEYAAWDNKSSYRKDSSVSWNILSTNSAEPGSLNKLIIRSTANNQVVFYLNDLPIGATAAPSYIKSLRIRFAYYYSDGVEYSIAYDDNPDYSGTRRLFLDSIYVKNKEINAQITSSSIAKNYNSTDDFRGISGHVSIRGLGQDVIAGHVKIAPKSGEIKSITVRGGALSPEKRTITFNAVFSEKRTITFNAVFSEKRTITFNSKSLLSNYKSITYSCIGILPLFRIISFYGKSSNVGYKPITFYGKNSLLLHNV